jgi:cytochrome b561
MLQLVFGTYFANMIDLPTSKRIKDRANVFHRLIKSILVLLYIIHRFNHLKHITFQNSIVKAYFFAKDKCLKLMLLTLLLQPVLIS